MSDRVRLEKAQKLLRHAKSAQDIGETKEASAFMGEALKILDLEISKGHLDEAIDILVRPSVDVPRPSVDIRKDGVVLDFGEQLDAPPVTFMLEEAVLGFVPYLLILAGIVGFVCLATLL